MPGRMDKTDEEVVADLQSGQTGAFEELFRRYKLNVLNFCLRLLNNRADAEDVTGDVFLALWKKAQSFTPQASFKTWLFTIARNACVDRLRVRKRWTSFQFLRSKSSEEAEWEVSDDRDIPRDELNRKETSLIVQQAIKTLPLEMKEAIILREYHQMSYKEIHHVLGCSKEKVKILIFRAREQLRARLNRPLKEDGDE